MEQRIIKLSVKNEYILGEGVVIGAAGSHDEVLLELDFRASPVWHGTTKKAVFYDALGTNPTTILLTTDKLVSGETEVYRISVPAEAKGQAGKCFLTIEGVVTNGETESVRVVTEAAQFDVLQSRRYEQTSDPNPVTPTQAEQLQAEIDDIKNTVSEAKDSADAAEASKKAAAASEQAAAKSETAAKASEAAAAGSAKDAAASKAAAAKSEADAKASETAAKSSETEAGKSAADAAASAGNALASANSAAGSATDAENAAAAAAESQAAAAASKNAAKDSKDAAAASAQGASSSASAAAQSAADAAGAKKAAESWAVGGTGTRTGEDTNNAKYWCESAQAAAGGGVTSFKGRGGAVVPQSGDYTPEMVGADPAGTANSKVSAHNKSADAHADIRTAAANAVKDAATVQKNLNTHDQNTTKHITAAERTAWNGKQAKLTGTAGQFVGFDADGNAVAVAAPVSVILDAIHITTPPSKTAYKAGETFNTAGMVVKADYSNGTVVIAKDIVVTGWNVTPSGPLAAGTSKVTVQYTENGITKTAEQAISVTRTVVAVPTQSGSLTYTGSAQSPTWSNYDSTKMTLGGATSGTNAGSYNATFTLKDTALYCWPDGTLTAKTVAWSIGKAAGTLSLSPATLRLEPGTLSGTFTIETNSTGAISVENASPSTITVTRSGKVVTVTSNGQKSGTVNVTVTVAGDDNHTAPAAKSCTVTCAFVSIYGVSWDGTSTTLLSRTDDAAGFTNPVAYMAGISNYGSPFDTKLPWSGMVVSEDSAAGKLVAIPKFWYKLTQSGNGLKIQIADAATDGFSVSPAHMDRGDGKGERDVVYIGRYHCRSSDYKSYGGSSPKNNITRSTARSGIHALGSTVWQSDFLMAFTIWLLYIVEYANWDSQAVIGYGCGNGSGVQSMGYTDSMPYHTGTTASARTTYGATTQYRNIEGLWDNCFDWMDGCYYHVNGMYVIPNPSAFSDNSGGVLVGLPTSGWISALSVKTVSSLPPLFIASGASGSGSTFVPDGWYYDASYPCLRRGGYYGQSLDYGMFFISYYSASGAYAGIGCRLQKLP